MKIFSKHNLPTFLLWLCIFLYIGYFATFTVLRYEKLLASYFDLGIMHQTVYNTYQGIKTGDMSLFLEMTDPHHSGQQVKRMSVHNDIILAFLAPLYVIHDSPITLLVIQTVVLALGAHAVFKITQVVLSDKKYTDWYALLFSFAYLMYPALQRSNIFDFHAVVFATTFLLYTYYFYLQKKYWASILFLVLSLFTKEQVGLTTFFMGGSLYLSEYYRRWKLTHKKITSLTQFLKSFIPQRDAVTVYASMVMTISVIWFLLSFTVIIPAFRGEQHFAAKYYGDYGDSPLKAMVGVVSNPVSLIGVVTKYESLRYVFFLFVPLLFISILSPGHIFISAPEFAINLLSANWGMQQIIYHYTAVIQPFIFISAIYGVKKLLEQGITIPKTSWHFSVNPILLGIAILLATLIFSAQKGPLWYSKEADMSPFSQYPKEYESVKYWQQKLADGSLKISSTGHVGPFFASRRYFYDFTEHYKKADYVILQESEIYNNFQQDLTIPAYEELMQDGNFEKVYDEQGIEVYKKITQDNQN